MNATVTVDQGGHTKRPIPKGLARLVEEELEAREVFGEYRLRFGPPHKGTPQMPPFRSRRKITQAGVELILKPGGNDTACICWLTPANSQGLRCEDLVERLRDPQDLEEEAPEPAGPPPSVRPMIDLSEVERDLRAEEERLLAASLEAEEGIRDREENIAVLQAEVQDLRARLEAGAAALTKVQERLAAVRAVTELVYEGSPA